MKTADQTWRNPPPGTDIVTTGLVLEGDWFYIETLGAWGQVPRIGWGKPIADRLIARGNVNLYSIPIVTVPVVPQPSTP